MFRKIRSIAGFAVLAALAACADNNGANDTVKAAADSAAQASESMQASSSTELVPLSFKQWESTRQSYMPDIVVVDLWATWCTPCLERFPHMVDMHNAYKDRGVQFVSLSLDDREDLSSVEFARTFLQQQNATFPNFLLDENIMDGFELIDIMTVPAVNIYDRGGRLVKQLNNNNPNEQFTDEDIEHAVNKLLEADGGSTGR